MNILLEKLFESNIDNKYYLESVGFNINVPVYRGFNHLYAKIFFNILNNLNLDYYVFAGTAIGYVRNKKNIPWVDDYDIIIFKEELDKFEKIIVPKLKYYGFKIYFTKLYFVGFVTFIFYLNSPLIINYLSIIFEEYSKIILQLTAILNFFPVLFVTFYMDPLIAKKIDESDDLDYLKGIYISIRLMSRLFIALFFNLLFIYNNFA